MTMLMMAIDAILRLRLTMKGLPIRQARMNMAIAC
eukprot:CAMPEP_0185756116 /NCGR_PEP_ID=MMETSP1174-20130828/14564_1 /TAXON_ID=35687 /ORGANISM="Dictyocha speculum, Strain CCMP1381" /LENGTH=34 /DNA_ID= /DNA_START= /DNA_END= /DNA_ORIENTATION=